VRHRVRAARRQLGLLRGQGAGVPALSCYLATRGALLLLALLALFERIKEVKVLALFGRTPMFFYVVHIALAHFLGNLYFRLRYGSTPAFVRSELVTPPGYAPALPLVYAAWLGGAGADGCPDAAVAALARARQATADAARAGGLTPGADTVRAPDSPGDMQIAVDTKT
jgi:hypothetical protein